MPVIVRSNEEDPLLPPLGSREAIEVYRAKNQRWRPLEIVIFNMMADKQATERQLAECLGRTPLQVHITYATTDSYVAKVNGGYESDNTPSAHIHSFYKPFSEIKDRKFDGLIVTGVNALEPCVTMEKFWPEITQLLAWSETNVFSSLFLCWGGMAALKHFHDIDSVKGETKLHGVFDHRVVSDTTGIVEDFSDVFPIPVSRWKRPDLEAIEKCDALEIVALSEETGANIIVESAEYETNLRYAKRVYVNGHPEYPTDELKKELDRDQERHPDIKVPLPRHYFTDNDPQKEIINTWRQCNIYRNWVEGVYQATPFDIQQVPRPFSSNPLVPQ